MKDGILNYTNMSYTSDLHSAYVKISSWYQDSSIFYSMSEDEALDAYDYLYATLRRFVDGPLHDETLTEEAMAERAAIEEMAPEVIFHLNSFISQAVFMPPIEEEKDQSNIMEQLDKHTIKSASFVLAGGACLLMIAGQLFSTHGAFPIRGFYLLNGLVIPVLCLWVGMLIRWKIGKPKWWATVIAGVAMIALFGARFFVQSTPYWLTDTFLWYGILLAGIMLPWEFLWENRDKNGIKPIVLLLLSTFAFCALDLVHDRMEVITLPTPYEDLGMLFRNVSNYAAPIAMLLPILFLAEFSFSKPGQWLGEQKWFRWIVAIASVICFIASIFNIGHTWGGLFMRCLTMILVQPVTVYLIIVICRIIRKLNKKGMTWKEVFAI